MIVFPYILTFHKTGSTLQELRYKLSAEIRDYNWHVWDFCQLRPDLASETLAKSTSILPFPIKNEFNLNTLKIKRFFYRII